MISEEEKNLTREFASKGISRDAELYLRAPDMIALARRAEELDLAVIGLEGFELIGQNLHPRLDLIADYSDASAGGWDEFRAICNEAAIRFLVSMPPGPLLVFNATLFSEAERLRSHPQREP